MTHVGSLPTSDSIKYTSFAIMVKLWLRIMQTGCRLSKHIQ